MILIATAPDLTEQAREKGVDALTLADINKGSGVMHRAQHAERVVIVVPPRFKVVHDLRGTDGGRAGYITSDGRNNLAVLLALWAEEDAAR